MDYDIRIPIILGIFTLVTAILIVYFMFLVDYLRLNKNHPQRVTYVTLHIVILVVGLLLTGFAT